MTTQENLLAAFAGESQANRRYLAFAKKRNWKEKRVWRNFFGLQRRGRRCMRSVIWQ